MYIFIALFLVIVALLGRAFCRANSSSSIVITVAMLLFFMGGVWFFPFVRGQTEVLLVISAINQLSCLAFILGVDVESLWRGSVEWRRASVIILSVFVGCCAVGFSSLWLNFLVVIGVEHDAQEMASLLLNERPEVQMGTILFVAVVAPIVEELLFRNLLLPALVKTMSDMAAVLCTGIIFGLMHLESWTSVPPLVVFGIVLGVLRLRYQSIMPSIIAHAVNNAVVVGTLIFL